MTPELLYLDVADGGRRLCVLHRPQGPVRGALLHLPPWAEEMNASRAVVAAQARALARAGWWVLQIDLYGCGDSDGEWRDATWARWLDDAAAAAQWLVQQAGGAPLWLWGLRSGALLAAQLAPRLATPAHQLWWQPVLDGAQLLRQFLRLHTAAQWLGAPPAAGATAEQRLAEGHTVRVAGYELSPALAQGLTGARLLPGPDPRGHVLWLDVLAPSSMSNAPTPASVARADDWRRAGWSVTLHAVRDQPFWSQVGGMDAPALRAATRQALGRTSGEEAP